MPNSYRHVIVVLIVGAVASVCGVLRFGCSLRLVSADENAEAAARLIDEGNQLSTEGRLQEALEHYTEALQRMPTNVAALNNRGWVHHLAGDDEAALADFRDALKLNGRCADVYFNRGTVLQSSGGYARSLEDFDRAIELSPDKAVFYLNRGVSFLNLGRTLDALEDFTRVLSLDNDGEYSELARTNLRLMKEKLEEGQQERTNGNAGSTDLF